MLPAVAVASPLPPNYRLNTDTGMRNDQQRGRGDLIPRLIIDFAGNSAAFRYVLRNYPVPCSRNAKDRGERSRRAKGEGLVNECAFAAQFFEGQQAANRNTQLACFGDNSR